MTFAVNLAHWDFNLPWTPQEARNFINRGGIFVTLLLKLSQLIDWLTERVGKGAFWLVLIMTIISAGNAVVRFVFNYSSNGLLEIQWYLFAAIFLLCSPYTLQKNEHVRIDVLSGKLSPRGLAVIDIIGSLFFLLPMVVMVLYLSLPLIVESIKINEMSANAGGLIRWPVKILLPIGFSLLALQGVSELIKRIAFLAGRIDDPNQKDKGPSAEEELAAAIAAAKAKEAK
jgi:TRAP-type mannitol/chloroaromatic compound transport system permease small subunit